ncbi:hypothetical protein BC938DRAFT_479025 [Jimgerdemannia flammicorona]|uniref:Mitochondrial ribosomal protein L27-domain-containing protein n=1 Tax=Jimgerdemannia flammicorona TaxID=994334 RepID=A0A433QLT1_9FUNG|nr:hypothetical protein BC938DRAFT_479025 [Jimgerdemannia flammicorona]
MFGVIRGIYRGAKRYPMTAKRGHNYYKGTGSGSTGMHTRRGGYIIDWNKVRTFKVPDLNDCNVCCVLYSFEVCEKQRCRHKSERLVPHNAKPPYNGAFTADNYLKSATPDESATEP